MCLFGCIALWGAGDLANREYFHLIEATPMTMIGANGENVLFREMVGGAIIGSVSFAAGCGLIYLGARERKKAQPIAIEVPDDPK